MGVAPPIRLAIESVDFFMRNVRTRLPFRYGRANLVSVPICHVRMGVRSATRQFAEGVSADILPPKWFDKSPAKDYRQNVVDLITAATIGANRYLEAGNRPDTPFAVWMTAYPFVLRDAADAELNDLTGGFGSSLMERAMIDAAGKLAGADFHTMVYENRLGFASGEVHTELAESGSGNWFAPQPKDTIFVRHTIGLADAIRENDVGTGDQGTGSVPVLEDGLPQSVEAWIRTAGIRYFKIKICGDPDTDLPRLQRIARLCADCAPPDYQVSLDGNEQFHSMDELTAWFEAAQSNRNVVNLLERVLFVEQPLERAIALDPAAVSGIAEFNRRFPVLIDESDDGINAFKHAVECGYRGISVKNCKGIFKALCNRLLVDLYNAERGGGYFLSGEDLMNLPVVPVQQDLCTLSVLGVEHAERNGHHYCHGLDHLTPGEVADCLRVHGGLYEPFNRSGRLRIACGQIDIRSLRQPGFGIGIPVDFGSMVPLRDWDFDSLGLSDA